MTERARACGLAFKYTPVPFAANCCRGVLHDSRTGLYRPLRPFYRSIATTDAASEYLSSTGVERTKDGYQPRNLPNAYQELQI